MTRLRFPQIVLIAAVTSAAIVVESAAQQETITLRGSVLDFNTAQPLAGVVVRLDGSTNPDTTNSSGLYRLSNLKPGPHEMVLLKDGYLPRTFNFALPEHERGDMNVEPLLLSRGRAPTLNITGSVIDSMTGMRVFFADVDLNGERLGGHCQLKREARQKA